MIRSTLLAAAAALTLSSPALAGTKEAGAVLGISTFVEQRCPTMRTNMNAGYLLMLKAGVDVSKGGPPPAVLKVAQGVMENLDSQPRDAVCAMIWEKWGANGSVQPDVYLRK